MGYSPRERTSSWDPDLPKFDPNRPFYFQGCLVRTGKYSQGDEDGRHHRLRPQHRQQEEERRQVQSKAVQRKGE